MAKANYTLIAAIRKAADRIKLEENYQWGHMGSCNCGHLAQELSRLEPNEIHEYAMRKYGDWTEQVMDYCPTSKMPFDLLISELISHGLDTKDLKDLEKLKNKQVLDRLPIERKHHLRHNDKDDVALYMHTWAEQLEEELV